MARKRFPLGSFTLHRRGWRVEEMAYGSILISSPSIATPQAALNNNASDGAYLAVYAILAWTSLNPQVAQVQVLPGTTSGGVTLVQQVYTNRAAIWGLISGVTTVNGDLSPSAPAFRAGGDSWMMMDGEPMWILAPNYRLVVWPWAPLGVTPLSGDMFVTFLWGLY